jgi:uncharacterized membrane protein YcfT
MVGKTNSGGTAGAGTGGYGNLNAVDITLVVFFSIFGLVLLAAVGWYVYKFSRKAVHDATTPALAQARHSASSQQQHDSKSEIKYDEE